MGNPTHGGFEACRNARVGLASKCASPEYSIFLTVIRQRPETQALARFGLCLGARNRSEEPQE